ncbi:hypothetical protein BDP55DRAFT_625704 [Colletotrichum godetiae]|uniref:Uncharacterized protein n=1 Tax=Colletotrichum godetiae TaxID=1209918 RepID=A0AAJ0F3B5_9PEZI|nr:uncharacterized protein BDP55DRAFT_625704 [Colletotrichum godetiae]KAK1701491.1 hypothetical protein BDP55DRAFT_625704 [Colletotrichum godetiae]
MDLIARGAKAKGTSPIKSMAEAQRQTPSELGPRQTRHVIGGLLQPSSISWLRPTIRFLFPSNAGRIQMICGPVEMGGVVITSKFESDDVPACSMFVKVGSWVTATRERQGNPAVAKDEAGALEVRSEGAPAKPSHRKFATTSSAGKNIRYPYLPQIPYPNSMGCALFPSEIQDTHHSQDYLVTKTQTGLLKLFSCRGGLHVDEPSCSPALGDLNPQPAASHKQSSTSQPCRFYFDIEHCLAISENLASRL